MHSRFFVWNAFARSTKNAYEVVVSFFYEIGQATLDELNNAKIVFQMKSFILSIFKLGNQLRMSHFLSSPSDSNLTETFLTQSATMDTPNWLWHAMIFTEYLTWVTYPPPLLSLSQIERILHPVFSCKDAIMHWILKASKTRICSFSQTFSRAAFFVFQLGKKVTKKERSLGPSVLSFSQFLRENSSHSKL